MIRPGKEGNSNSIVASWAKSSPQGLISVWLTGTMCLCLSTWCPGFCPEDGVQEESQGGLCLVSRRLGHLPESFHLFPSRVSSRALPVLPIGGICLVAYLGVLLMNSGEEPIRVQANGARLFLSSGLSNLTASMGLLDISVIHHTWNFQVFWIFGSVFPWVRLRS